MNEATEKPTPASIKATPSTPSPVAVAAAFAIVYVVWGSTYLAMRIAVRTLPPFTLAGFRFLTAGLILFAWSMRKGAPAVTRRHLQEAALSGILLLAIGNGAVVWAVQDVPSGLVALMIATVPLFTVLLAWLFEGTRPRPLVIAGLAGGLFGLGALVGPGALGNDTGTVSLSHAAVLLVAALSWAAGSLRTRHVPPLPGRPFLFTGMQMLVGGLTQVTVAAVTGELARIDTGTITPASWFAFFYLIAFGSLIAYSAFGWLLQNAPPARVATYAYVNPVIAVLLGWALGGEPMSLRIAFAAAVILTSVAAITRGSHTAK